jgi:hypothetical protein
VEEEIGGGYTDAESSIENSQSTLLVAETQVPLIFPHYDDLENSFASSTTGSDGTTPSASVQLPLSQVVKGQRSSSYRLSLDKGVAAGASDGKGEVGNKGESLWNLPIDGTPHQALANTTGDKTDPAPIAKEVVEGDITITTAQEIREGVKKDRMMQALASANLARLRGGQKWLALLSCS